jgi:hypothetical protein
MCLDHQIICDGNVGITHNCDNILHRLRGPESTLVLWGDYICTNKVLDMVFIQEKKNQVHHMDLAYEMVDRVLVRLGDSDNIRTAGVFTAWKKSCSRISAINTWRRYRKGICILPKTKPKSVP